MFLGTFFMKLTIFNQPLTFFKLLIELVQFILVLDQSLIKVSECLSIHKKHLTFMMITITLIMVQIIQNFLESLISINMSNQARTVKWAIF